MTTIITNIKELLQVRNININKVSGKEMNVLPTIKNAFLIIKDDTIEAGKGDCTDKDHNFIK